jgi:hypothetical protein
VGVPRAELDAVSAVVHDVMAHAPRVGHALTLTEVSSVLDAAF